MGALLGGGEGLSVTVRKCSAVGVCARGCVRQVTERGARFGAWAPLTYNSSNLLAHDRKEYMARKLTEEERNNINLLTGVLCRALPASQRNFGASIASALVRIPRDVITEKDLKRVMTKYAEQKEELTAVVKAQILDLVAQGEKPSETTYTLRIPAEETEPAQSPEDESTSEQAASEASGETTAEVTDEVVVEQQADAEAKPEPKKKRTRTRSRKKKAGEAEVEAAPVDGGEEAAVAVEEKVEAATEVATEVVVDAQVEAVAEASVEAEAPAEPEEAAEPEEVLAAEPEAAPVPEPTPAFADDKKPAGPGKTRRSSRRGGPKSNNDQTLAKVPYIRRGGEGEAQIRAKIVTLDQRFWLNGWLLSHPGAYTLYEKEICGLNDALRDGMLPGDITRRQLAYQMGGDEKFFEYGSDGFRLLRAMGMEDVIRHRPMPKADILYHAPRRRKHMRVLVTENLDPWLDVRDLMYEEGRSVILGERVHAVVLGGGMPVLEHNRLALLLDSLRADTIEVLYWGDIDRAGLDIYAKLDDLLDAKYNLAPFTPGYQLMCDRAMERFPDPCDNEQTGQINIEVGDCSLLTAGLTPEAADYARAVIENCGLVPQEILTKRDL